MLSRATTGKESEQERARERKVGQNLTKHNLGHSFNSFLDKAKSKTGEY